MKVREVMTTQVATCVAGDDLDRVAQLLWDTDCGALPVASPERRVIGMITDRDVCMAAFTKGRALRELRVIDHMTASPAVCQVDDTLESAAAHMGERGVRRLPVVDEAGLIVGVVAINDIARAAARANARDKRGLTTLAADVMAAVGAPRNAEGERVVEVQPKQAAKKKATSSTKKTTAARSTKKKSSNRK